MKKAPTLADRIIRESLRPRGSVNRALGRDLIEAKKFVLNKEASAFLADLSHAAYEPGIKLESKNACLDRARVLSRPTTTWSAASRAPASATRTRWRRRSAG